MDNKNGPIELKTFINRVVGRMSSGPEEIFILLTRSVKSCKETGLKHSIIGGCLWVTVRGMVEGGGYTCPNIGNQKQSLEVFLLALDIAQHPIQWCWHLYGECKEVLGQQTPVLVHW